MGLPQNKIFTWMIYKTEFELGKEYYKKDQKKSCISLYYENRYWERRFPFSGRKNLIWK